MFLDNYSFTFVKGIRKPMYVAVGFIIKDILELFLSITYIIFV